MGWHLTSGKGQAVQAKLGLEGLCICHFNADVGSACGAHLDRTTLDGVLSTLASGADSVPTKMTAGCDYCFAWRTNTPGDITLARLGAHLTRKDRRSMQRSFYNAARIHAGWRRDAVDKERFDVEKPFAVRIGKNTDPGFQYARERLMFLLELCDRYRARPMTITKTLEFDTAVGERLAKTRGALNYSIGIDRLEPGLVQQGMTNAWRFDQAVAYHEAYRKQGLHVALFLNVDASRSSSAIEAAGYYAPEAIRRVIAYNAGRPADDQLYLRGVALRGTVTSHPKHLLGGTRADLTVRGQLFSDPDAVGQMHRRGNSELMSDDVHQDWRNLFASGASCGYFGNGGQFYEGCDQCALLHGGRPNMRTIPVKREVLFRPPTKPEYIGQKNSTGDVSSPLFS